MTGVAMRRGPVTWYCYLSLGFFTYLLNIQGNILPFLKDELGLSYRAVSLHSSAIALGLIAVGASAATGSSAATGVGARSGSAPPASRPGRSCSAWHRLPGPASAAAP